MTEEKNNIKLENLDKVAGGAIGQPDNPGGNGEKNYSADNANTNRFNRIDNKLNNI